MYRHIRTDTDLQTKTYRHKRTDTNVQTQTYGHKRTDTNIQTQTYGLEVTEHTRETESRPESESFRYLTLGGAPLGGPPPTYPCVDVAVSIALLHLVSHYPAVVFIVLLFCHAARANLFIPVARVLLLLHFPRFPFHDSTGSCFSCNTNGK